MCRLPTTSSRVIVKSAIIIFWTTLIFAFDTLHPFITRNNGCRYSSCQSFSRQRNILFSLSSNSSISISINLPAEQTEATNIATIQIKQLRQGNNTSYVPFQLRNITIKGQYANSKIIYQRQSLGEDFMDATMIPRATTGKSNKRKLEWIAESAKKLSSPENSTEEIVNCLISLERVRSQKDVVLVGQKIRQLVAAQKNQLCLHHKDVVQRVIKACSIVGLIDISFQLLLHLIVVENFIPDSKAYVAVLQCQRKLGQISKMKQVLDALSETRLRLLNTTSYNATDQPSLLDVVALNVYIAALREDLLQEGRPTSKIPLLQRLQQAIELLRPNASLERFHVQPDTYSYNTVLNAVSRNHEWRNRSIIVDDIRKWMSIDTELSSLGRMSSKAFSGDIVTVNALIRGHVESRDYNAALNLIDTYILGDEKFSYSSNSAREITADRYTVDLAIQPLLQNNRTDDVLRLIHNYCESSEALGLKSSILSDILAAFLTRIAIGAQNPVLAEKILHEMYQKRNSAMPSPSTRHYNVVIEGYRRLLTRRGEVMLTGDEATKLWRSMIDRSIRPDKYTLTSIIGQFSTAEEIKQTWAESMQHLGINPTEISCTSLITQLGVVGDGSASCAVFDWMLYCDKNGRTLPRSLRIWNALLGSLVSRDHLLHRINISLANDISSWLCYDRIKRDSDLSCITNMTVSEVVNGLTQVEAAKRIFYMMLVSSKSDNSIPSPDSQSFCLIAAALARVADSEDGIMRTSNTVKGCLNMATEAMDLFRLSVREQIPADGRFLNAIIRCFGSDITSAIDAWKSEIGHVARAYNREKGSGASTGNSNLMAAYHGLFTVCGRGGRPDIAVRLAYAMRKEGIEPSETALNCYLSGKRRRHKDWTLKNGEFPVPSLIVLEKQHESMLIVECSQYDARDRKRVGDKKVRIIF